MMIKPFYLSFCLSLALWFAGSHSAMALEWKADIILSPAAMTWSGPADSVVPGHIIGAQWSTTTTVTQVFWCGLVFTCSKGTMTPGADAVPSGLNIELDGVRYAIFETGVPGIGYIIGLKDSNATAWLPLQEETTQTYPADGSAGYASDLGWSAKVTFVKTSTALKSGVYQTPTINAAVLTAYNNETKTANVTINPATITVTASGCIVATRNASVNLGRVNTRDLPDEGSTSPASAFNVALTCDAGVSLYAVVSDQSDPGNRSTALSLTGDSGAEGVGVQVFYNDTGPLALGPDSSASGTANQFFIKSQSAEEQLNLPFTVRYVRTGPLVPGTANALASITFSYQ